MIAVMGDTSSGKSALLSAIAEVQFPSNKDLTTRCPIVLRMERADAVAYSVRIQWVATKDGPVFEARPRDMALLTEDIARAQEVILKHCGRPSRVSRDKVEVRVAGPRCTDLTLVDLPGIVRNTGKDEDVTLVEDIQAILHDYLPNERCVILAVCPANVDFHNVSIMADAKKVDPGTIRTIPVITKPDLVDKGAEGSVIDLLIGRKMHDFILGLHMVKGRSQKDLDNKMPVEDGLAQEEEYFADQACPWRAAGPKLLGTEQLKGKLSRLYMDILQRAVPGIRKEMLAMLATAKAELGRLGVSLETASEKRQFLTGILCHVQSRLDYRAVDALPYPGRPNWNYWAVLEEMKRSFATSVLKTDFADLDLISERKKVTYFIDTKTGRTYKEGVVDSVSLEGVRIAGCKDLVPLSNVSCDITASNDLVDLVRGSMHHGINVYPSNDVIEGVVRGMIRTQWAPLCDTFVSDAIKLLKRLMNAAIEAENIPTAFPRLELFLRERMEDDFSAIEERCRMEVAKALEKEHQAFTQNHYFVENLMKARHAALLRKIKNAGTLAGGQVNLAIVETIFAANSGVPIDEAVAEELGFVLAAYGKVASKRVIDIIPMVFHEWCVVPYTSNEKKRAREETVDDSVIADMLCVSDSVARQGAALREKIDKLNKGILTLKMLKTI